MKPKFTSGPWLAFKYPDVKTWTVSSSESVASKIKISEDAHLIAAAPEMYEALEIAEKYIQQKLIEVRELNDGETPERFKEHLLLVRSALKKAEGKS